MRIRTEIHLWLFIGATTVFAALAVVFEQAVLYPILGPLLSNIIIAPLAAMPISYFVGRKFQELTRLYDEREELINYDRLTRVLSREGFLNRLDGTRRRGGIMLMMDIDHFKSVNDTYGHLAGDRILRHVATVLSSSVRPGDLLSRFGGEEFIAFLPETTRDEAAKVAERIRTSVATASVEAAGEEITVTISIGAAEMRTEADLETALRNADAALYRAKNAGRNRLMMHTVSKAA